MSYQDLFPRYGNPQNPTDVGVRAYILRPAELKEAKDVVWYDRHAADAIRDMEAMIENLRDYRKALAARYAELETMPYKLRLELQRVPLYDGHKVYNIRLIRAYEDGSEVVELRESYKGKDRREALARFDALCKARPGIEIVKDIARRQWER